MIYIELKSSTTLALQTCQALGVNKQCIDQNLQGTLYCLSFVGCFEFDA